MIKYKISPRLRAISELVEDKPYVDIGADHGYLDLHLINNGHKGPIAVTENKKGPYERLCKNIDKSECGDIVTCVFADGLNFDYREYKQLVISGMGGSLIVSILQKAKFGLDNFDTLILEPQSDLYFFRSTIIKLGYEIVSEKYILERSKTYPIIKCRRGESHYSDVMLHFGRLPLENKDEILYNHLIKNKLRIEKILRKRSVDPESKQALDKQLNLIEEGLKYYGK